MKTCPNCKKTYEDEANFCPEEACATDAGPRRLDNAAGGTARGRFSPTDKIGGGRTGEVWQALDAQTGDTVALKFLDPSIAGNPVTAGRVDRELKQLMRVDNPHVVRVVDVGKMPDGRMYVASQLVPAAESLATVLRRGAVPLDQAKQILAQIGAGLLEAQKAGLVHRDLAPKNIFVDAAGQVKVGNFALAVPVDDRLSGVAEYASPEQAQGRPVDQRSNTYSLACIFYHLLTGEPPFTGGDAKAIFELHASSLPLAPSQRRPEASLSAEVDRVILKALEKNSSKRPLTLRLFLNEVETLAGPPASTGKADAGGVGFAKTMLFAGGQSEVQAMVQRAIAQRQAAQATPAAPATHSPMPAPTPPPVVVPSPVMAAAPPPAVHTPSPVRVPQAADGSLAAAARLTPPPVTPNPLQMPQAAASGAASSMAKQAAPAAAAGAGGSKGAAFRETLWFKKGDVEQMVAEAKAKVAAAGGGAEKIEKIEAPEDIRPIEDRYVDDGSVTTDDRKNFSLRQGHTATALPVVGKSLPGEKMSDKDIVGELAPARKIMVFVGVGVAALVVVITLFVMFGKKEPALAPTPAAPAAAAAPAPVPAPPPPAPPPPAPVAAAVAAPSDPRPAASKPRVAKPIPKKKTAKAKR